MCGALPVDARCVTGCTIGAWHRLVGARRVIAGIIGAWSLLVDARRGIAGIIGAWKCCPDARALTARRATASNFSAPKQFQKIVL